MTELIGGFFWTNHLILLVLLGHGFLFGLSFTFVSVILKPNFNLFNSTKSRLLRIMISKQGSKIKYISPFPSYFIENL